MYPHTLRWSNFHLTLGPRTAIMGIVNVTPDSFSDGGRFYGVDAAEVQAQQLIAAGADIIDIGGESTRPFAEQVPAQAEIDRVVPVIERLAATFPIPVSIDTTKAEVAEAALAAGAAMINDISALTMDPRMAETAARWGVPVILMHMKGSPRTMQINPHYDDLMAEIIAYLKSAMAQATAAGIPKTHLIIDPGIGFGKTISHNLKIIQQLGRLSELEAPILIGPSRKAFIRKLLASGADAALTVDRPEVETGTQAALAMAIINGAHIVRVHDVANTKAMVTIVDAIRTS
ncbi:MAG: dihydropteroate synthase [Desulfatitalea sp.]|nr:dihydropteroate synthase [Desulfatitalea sp.]NNK01017.1 dihydropteroate synthase [Desulfatitalea sp.]